MLKKLCGSVLFLCLFSAFGYASEQNPVAVSPGHEIGIAVISDPCPTFSWTAVKWARRYRVEVFLAPDDTDPVYLKAASLSQPMLVKEIPGAATSWTPSADESLSNSAICRGV